MMNRAGNLLSDTAHDLRSPLAAARELVQLVVDGIDGPVSPQQRDHLETVVDRCNDMQQLIDDMLHHECMRTGTPRLHKTWLSPSTLPNLVQPLVDSKLQRRALNLEWIGFESTLPPVFADVDKIRRLLVNLIENAIRVVPEGGSITVRTEISQSADRIRLSVSDNGAGMSAEKLRQLATRGTNSEQGHGLGLSICRQIAALHYSQLKVASELNQGTRFSVELAAGDLRAVLDHFSSWREQVLANGTSTILPQAQTGQAQSGHAQHTNHRTDPKIEPGSNQVELASGTENPRNARAVALVAAYAIEPLDAAGVATYDMFMQSQCAMHELVYQVQRGQWVLAMDCNLTEARQRIQAIETARRNQPDATLTQNPLQWSGPITQAIGMREDRDELCSAFVRDSVAMPVLSSNKLNAISPSASALDNTIAQRRLENEVQWLMRRFRNSQDRLHRHTRALRRKK